MDRSLGLFIIGLVFGGGIGFAIAAANGVTFDGHDHSDPAQHAGMDHAAMGHADDGDHAMMHDTPLEVDAMQAPELAIMVSADPMAGYNLHVMVQNFAFSPQNASGADVPGEGHAHVYVNGEKLGRLYGAWYHIDTLPVGENEVLVTLNSNNHQPLAVNGKVIEASTKVVVE
ncbi:hypothetical protein [Sulfitobacter sp. JB4-11]|uniref:hypothetical protein n=1 Tax=Sulfitobacter rhodophyticola TaxID=3238304 RepID=UPI0035110FA1